MNRSDFIFCGNKDLLGTADPLTLVGIDYLAAGDIAARPLRLGIASLPLGSPCGMVGPVLGEVEREPVVTLVVLVLPMHGCNDDSIFIDGEDPPLSNIKVASLGSYFFRIRPLEMRTFILRGFFAQRFFKFIYEEAGHIGHARHPVVEGSAN